MTTTVLLIRHGSHDRLGRELCGRMPGVTLNRQGRDEAAALASRLARSLKLDAIFTSPLERARETAEPIGRAFGLPVEIDDALNEADFGIWAGQTFLDLHKDPRWNYWNRERDHARPPGGETLTEAQGRMVSVLERLRPAPVERSVALVSHADMIKTALAWGLGLPLAFYGRFEIAPASVSRMILGPDHVKIWSMNEEVAS